MILLVANKSKKVTIFTYESLVFNSWNLGRLDGSYDQHSIMIWYNVGGQFGGRASRSPLSILPMTFSLATPWKGFTPYIIISQIHTPNIHTSLSVENLRKLIDSGAIHLMGSLPFDATEARNEKEFDTVHETEMAERQD